MNNLKRILIAGILAVVVVIFVGIWWLNGVQPVNVHDKSEKLFSVKKATGMRELANNLKQDGLIKSPVVFFLLVKKLGLDSKIQAGEFRLSPSMSAEEIAKSLTVGTLDVWITIPEGKRADEIADLLKENFPDDYTEEWRTMLESHEGYLFPDTYSFSKDTDIQTIQQTLLTNFDKKYAEITAGPNNLSKEQIVILASMVEREAKHADDRPLVASVMLNRLAIGMPLQIDSTIQYALGYQQDEQTWWKKDLSLDDLKIVSDYNTYTHTGLPPGPIANPGFDALNAVVHPAMTEYIYYISDKSGINHYAKTAAEHNANIKKYGL